MPSARPPRAQRPPSRQLYIDDETWKRIQDIGWLWKPTRRSASDLIREMVEYGLPKIEAEFAENQSRSE